MEIPGGSNEHTVDWKPEKFQFSDKFKQMKFVCPLPELTT